MSVIKLINHEPPLIDEIIMVDLSEENRWKGLYSTNTLIPSYLYHTIRVITRYIAVIMTLLKLHT